MYTIMIIDDDTTSLAISKALLEDDYEVIVMNSGLQALGHLKNHPDVDLILLDMIMPGTDGMTVLQELKANQSTKEIPVIFSTCLDGSNTQADALAAGASDFLTKPVHQELMKLKIAHHIQFVECMKENRLLKQRLKLILKILEGVES